MKVQNNAFKLGLIAAGIAFVTTGAHAESNAMKSLNSNDVEAQIKLYDDLDQDGVNDSSDHCPNSARGATVDATGCTPVIEPEINTAVEAVTIYEPVVEQKINAPLPEPIFTMNSAFFDLDKATLRPSAINTLRANLSALDNMKANDNLLIMGHTCDLGPDAYNMRLSWRRANSVKNFIEMEKPNLANRIYIVGRGEQEPMVSNTSEANRQQNRRVELRVLPGNQILPSDATQTMPAGMDKRK
ncbi:hypothetical protein THMIRHAS_02640 [Thiosulfatimonas sediminis]|uniref:OmpA-like domain-containing protein n=1 Tax=Thiosulfatimonas sediminis TaxID=2675054 RepID=A0A6F8PRY8_9GAMM|nr:OmpA family protein [Thiosulfatimonas sediminis]BBP44891.1 hypothetical protein THMIRHAS_02640 [Thiosulfatimonas sediminis]